MSKLTAIQVRNLKPEKLPFKISDGHGLWFHIAKSGGKTWRYRFKILGRESTFVLGEYPKMSLKEAREARAEARELVKLGKNPAKERKKAKQETVDRELELKAVDENCFRAVALEWIDNQKGKWKSEHANAVRATLEHDAFPVVGDFPVDSIQPPTVLKILRSIEKRGSLEIARKVLQRMSAVFRYAIQTGRATYNPAADMKGVIKTRKVIHQAALSIDEMPEFLKKMQTADIHINTKLALQFTILTAARSGETRFARWDEIDIEERMWRIPAERMKVNSPHNVPLSNQARAILERVGNLYGRDGYIFPGIRDSNKPLSENTMLYAMYRMGYHSRSTVHGFRAVFSTIANESGFDGDVIEKALAHEQRNKVRAAYHRSHYIEQRRDLMQWWADLLQKMENEPG
ncbi:Integrase [Desulfocapsa sulfexigens DSM 10523]|uniref:Integrase n=1 Tax=Desulfocapsa sulfexigens (strain DSM 10523 / SB164P1) TaxID=1167006 RepID=M1PBU8_DESSD|nr:integrase arm-type DNA-binding domain-containing protein [Desulfocapsa sulfexigens]AGF77240.1 Integrase [Desulfocapsa sulfexigens DSM 10523]